MSTSDIKKRALRSSFTYLAVSLLCAVFGFIYELFSHGVFSPFMAFCFLPPLLFGVIPFLAVYFKGMYFPHRLAYNLYNSGVSALTAGFIFTGVLQIYGTTNRLSAVYYAAAAVFTVSGIILWIYGTGKDKKTLEKSKNV